MHCTVNIRFVFCICHGCQLFFYKNWTLMLSYTSCITILKFDFHRIFLQYLMTSNLSNLWIFHFNENAKYQILTLSAFWLRTGKITKTELHIKSVKSLYLQGNVSLILVSGLDIKKKNEYASSDIMARVISL